MHTDHTFFNSKEFEKLYFYQGKLGAIYSDIGTRFRVWAPTADKVNLVTYASGHKGEGTVYKMERGKKGTWQICISGDCHGLYYNYQVTVNNRSNEVVDPYAKACGVNGKRGMVVDLKKTNPDGWANLSSPQLTHFTDAIIYELHIRDLSIHPKSGIKNSGKFLGLAELNTKGPDNVSTGLDHLKELGITHVQLLPCSDFATVDERGGKKEYNWGYDPLNYNVPEGSYSTDPYNGEVRIKEFKQLIKTLKENGIRVIMDVVYNHTYHSTDSHFNLLVPGYYYRQDAHGHFTNGSGVGNEIASERAMVRKFIIDSVVYWATEYKIDGFRFDLMGLHDIHTINEIRSALNSVDQTIIMYGEGWTGGHSPLPDYKKSLKGNVKEMPGTGVFNDDVRDGLKGPVFYADQHGFVNGAFGVEESVKCGIVGAINHDQVDYQQVMYTHVAWAGEPAQSINYVEAHDNRTLWDRLAVNSSDKSEEERIAMHKMCGAIILTSQGVSFLHAGMEFLRTKNDDHNSYKSPDIVNQLDWARKAKYQQVVDYYRGLIELRKTHPAFRMRTAVEVQDNLRFLPMPDSLMLSFLITNHANSDPWWTIIVIFNANSEKKTVQLPGNDWIVVVNKEKAGVKELNRINDNKVLVPAKTSLVLVDAVSFYNS